jgi:16S rRNA (cytosine967-C5)-methyltransferase
MTSPARILCYKLLNSIESRRLFSDDALNSEVMLRLEVRDRHLTTEIVYGTLRWQALLDYILAGISARSWGDVAVEVKILLRMSLYQMWQMDRIPEYALVNDAVEIAKRHHRKGIDGFVNGVLRSLARTHPWENKDFLQNAPDWIRASIPQWLWDRWSARYGKCMAMKYALSLNSSPQMALRLTEIAPGPEVLPFKVAESNLVPGAYIRSENDIAQLPAEKDAEYFKIQDEASQLIPHLLDPQPGWMVWDACAAPGGKSAILSKICGHKGRVIASDLRKERIRRLIKFMQNSGAENTDVLIADASSSPPFRKVFDGVLVDAPCSGLGTLRRNPEIKWRFHSQEFNALQKIQIQILHHASESIRMGGRLLYSTCSTEPEENEQVIQSFLGTHRHFQIMKPDHPPGIEIWTGRDLMVRTFPSQYLWDGFFAALMTRGS